MVQMAVKCSIKARWPGSTAESIEVPLIENEYEGFTTQGIESLHEADVSMAINFSMVPISPRNV